MGNVNPHYENVAPPPTGPPLSFWRKVRLVIKVAEVRLRFIAILLAMALFVGYWDTIKNYWDKYMRPATATVRALAPDQEFYCPMHLQVTRSTFEPNGEVPKCPICGMPLSLHKKGQAAALPPGVTGRVQLSPERIQLAGIETVEVRYQPLLRQISTVGNVTYDESRLSRVVSRVGGYVEKLYVDTTFSKVQQGEPLAEIYSPELYTTAQELAISTKRGATADLAGIARERLKLLGVSPQEIDAIVRSGVASPRLVIRAPRSGYVIGKQIVSGSRVEEGMTLLDVADLSVVWIEADVYEKDVSLLHAGEKIEATVESLPGRAFSGKVALVYPRLDTATRSVRVRFEVENPQQQLRPGMYANVRLSAPLEENEPSRESPQVASEHNAGDVLAVPESAVVDTGSEQIVYVQRAPGLFEGVRVELGPRSEGVYPVRKGLAAGDRIAAAGAFLIDAETRLNPAAASTYFGASGGPQTAAGRTAAPSPQVADETMRNIAALSAGDQLLARQQKVCPITGSALGSMGVPHKIVLKGQTILLCCPGCVDKAMKAPDEILKKVAEPKAAH